MGRCDHGTCGWVVPFFFLSFLGTVCGWAQNTLNSHWGQGDLRRMLLKGDEPKVMSLGVEKVTS